MLCSRCLLLTFHYYFVFFSFLIREKFHSVLSQLMDLKKNTPELHHLNVHECINNLCNCLTVAAVAATVIAAASGRNVASFFVHLLASGSNIIEITRNKR